MKTAEWLSVMRRLREAERTIKKWPVPPAEPLRFIINEGTASARLQAAGILQDETGIHFTLRIGHEDEDLPTLLPKPDA